eukprot:TRINITY_DN22410_c0_g1_i1.p1 TRINITY_DN22410_c0_g1~~TRINITY_DN22410_c0_g1_i1.p1  ORF type:complete len:390 (+),score=72.15 TRINITY_DN22410_c0_g1_i1:168-1337(+)
MAMKGNGAASSTDPGANKLSVHALLAAGRAKYEVGDYGGALADYTTAVCADATCAIAWESRGMVRGMLGDYDGGIKDCTESLRLDPQKPLVWCHRGTMRLENGDYDGAIADCTEAMRLNPKISVAWNDRGGAKLEKGDLEGALKDYSEGLRLNPRNANAWHNRGIVKHESGDFAGAIADFRKAMSVDPELRAARRGLTRAQTAQSNKIHWYLEPLPAVAVAAYVEAYGYEAACHLTWQTKPTSGSSSPELQLQVTGHVEEGGHTWYVIECSLKCLDVCPKPLRWRVQRRLVQLRESLHDPVKKALMDDYVKQFGDAPFARHGGLPGTSARLQEWLNALSRSIDNGVCSPSVVAHVLQFLDVVDPPMAAAADSGTNTRFVGNEAELRVFI